MDFTPVNSTLAMLAKSRVLASRSVTSVSPRVCDPDSRATKRKSGYPTPAGIEGVCRHSRGRATKRKSGYPTHSPQPARETDAYRRATKRKSGYPTPSGQADAAIRLYS